MIELNIRMPRLFAEGPGELQLQVVLETRSFTAIYGPSGAGKTTLLRILAGLAHPAEGYVSVDGEVWLDTERKINKSVQTRPIGFVFQDTALFPNMTVLENLSYAAIHKKDPFIDELLNLIGLESFARRKPDKLSGGQRQRVALARALVRRPKVLLLDEPFSSVDAETSQLLREELLKLHHHTGTTTLLVTHNQEDIQRLADRKIGLKNGHIQVNTVVSALDSADSSMIESIIHIDWGKRQIETKNFLITAKNDLISPSQIQLGDELTLTLKTLQPLNRAKK